MNSFFWTCLFFPQKKSEFILLTINQFWATTLPCLVSIMFLNILRRFEKEKWGCKVFLPNVLFPGFLVSLDHRLTEWFQTPDLWLWALRSRFKLLRLCAKKIILFLNEGIYILTFLSFIISMKNCCHCNWKES